MVTVMPEQGQPLPSQMPEQQPVHDAASAPAETQSPSLDSGFVQAPESTETHGVAAQGAPESPQEQAQPEQPQHPQVSYEEFQKIQEELRKKEDLFQKLEELAAKLPPGIGYEWTGISYEEQLSSGQAPALYALSLLIVFLCLAALYESWSVPIAVLLVVPLGVVGTVIAANLAGLNNDIYLQVGLITTIGVSAKNAILIVEFAEERMRSGMGAAEAALQAARLRLRPILMTSFAFVFGVLPLALSSGAGAGGQNAIGWAVVGGMLSATVLAIFFVPLFFFVVKRLFRQDGAHARSQTGAEDYAGDARPQEA